MITQFLWMIINKIVMLLFQSMLQNIDKFLLVYVSILKQQQIRMNYIEEISIKVKQKIWKIIKYQKLLLLYINW